ncbi:MAG TPA: DUF177 domain-containing protein [Stellaceae bacterium]|nr:DUF177 domain-containing protein [Stellaceae bacterium]
MSAATPEFSRLVPLARLGRDRLPQRIEATPAEREALARRLDLVALDRLSAVTTLWRDGSGEIVLEAAWEAEFVQNCVATLEPVAGAASDSFVLRYGREEATGRLLVLGLEEADFEPLVDDAIDVGEAVAQELSLSLPAFPRHPDAASDASIEAERAETPLAALSALRPRGAG